MMTMNKVMTITPHMIQSQMTLWVRSDKKKVSVIMTCFITKNFKKLTKKENHDNK